MDSKFEEGPSDGDPQTGLKRFSIEDCKEIIYELGHLYRIPYTFRYKQGIEYVRERLMLRYGDMNLDKALGVFNNILENGSASGLGDDDDVWRSWRYSFHHQHDDFSDPGTPRSPNIILPHRSPQRHATTTNVQSPAVNLENARVTSDKDTRGPGRQLPPQPSSNRENKSLTFPEIYLPAVEALTIAAKKTNNQKAPTREEVAPKILTWNDGQEGIQFPPKISDFEARVAQANRSKDCTDELLARRPSPRGKTTGPLVVLPPEADEMSELAGHQHDLDCVGVGIFSKLRRITKKKTPLKDPAGKAKPLAH